MNNVRRLLSVLLCISIFGGTWSVESISVYGAETIFTLTQAQNLALCCNKSYQRTKSKISMQQIKYAAAVKSIQLKKKNMATFRWTPLLSFKFPEKADLADEFQWQYKPLQIQTQINALTHQLTDTAYEILEKVSVLFVQAYAWQEKDSFAQERMESLQAAVARNEARLKTGEAKQADVDKMKSSLEKLEKDRALYQRSLARAKKKISDLTGMDITAGYRLKDPLVTADISREMLPELLAHTRKEDQGYYEAKLNAQLALTSVNLNESLMQKQYGEKMNIIKLYLNQAKNGEEIEEDSFRSAYNRFLEEIDMPWQGKKKILFLKIPKEWFKGAISGVRYVEDDPYALYTAVLDYQDAYQDQLSMEKELTESVEDYFETLITARNAYQSLCGAKEQERIEIERASLKNRLGELEYQELSALQDSYEETQIQCMEALASYSELLYGFDRLTCGGITACLRGESLNRQAIAAGDSFPEREEAKGAFYFIQSQVEDHVFVFGISIPEDFNIEITAYELWVDGVQIGARVEKDKQIRHLLLSFDHPGRTAVRLFQGDSLVEEVEIDAQVNQGELPIHGGYRIRKERTEKKAASFFCETDARLKTASIHFLPEPGENIAFYQVADEEGRILYSERLVPITEHFRYLSVMAGDLSKLQVIFYDSGGQKMYQGRLEEWTGSVMVPS